MKFEATEEELKALKGLGTATLETSFIEGTEPYREYDPEGGDCCEECGEFEEFIYEITGELFDATSYLKQNPPMIVDAAILIDRIRTKLLNLIEDGE